MDIRLYTKSDLLKFTPEVLSNFNGEIPVTSLRVKSFVNNPNINNNDILLIAYYKENKLASYFGILPDFSNTGEKIYWNTGWRANRNIDKRAAAIVFYKALKLYGNKMVLNHLTPHTKQVIDSTKVFEKTKTLIGKKYFLKSVISEIIIARKPKLKFLKFFLDIGDSIGNFALSLKKNTTINNEISVIILNHIDEESNEFINNIKNEFINSSVTNINHCLQYKWLATEKKHKQENKKYFFSLRTKKHKNYILKLTIKGVIIGVFHIVNRNGNFKLYYSYFNNSYVSIISDIIYNFIQQENAKTFLCFDNLLNASLTDNKFLYTKTTVQFYTYSSNLKNLFNQRQKFQAGFGDVMYT